MTEPSSVEMTRPADHAGQESCGRQGALLAGVVEVDGLVDAAEFLAEPHREQWSEREEKQLDT